MTIDSDSIDVASMQVYSAATGEHRSAPCAANSVAGGCMIDYRLSTAFLFLVIIVLFGAPIVLGVLLASGRGISNTIHRPRLGWAVVSGYLVLGLISVLIFVVGGDDESRDDGPAIVIGLIGFPWSLLII